MLETHLGYLYARERTRTGLVRHGDLDARAWRQRTAGLLRALTDRLARP